MIFKFLRIYRWFQNWHYRLRPPEMVQYWKHGDKERCKLVTLKDGSYGMIIRGEKYPLYGFPRGPMLFGPLMRLKYLGKNLVFNQPWRMLEEGKSSQEVAAYLKNAALPVLLQQIETLKYDMFPPEKLCPAVREIWRAMSAIEQKIVNERERLQFEGLKKGITFLLQEDDAYRFRFQFVAKYINPRNPIRRLYYFLKRKPYSIRKE